VLAQRLIAAAIGIPLILAVILIGGALYTLVACAILALATLEFMAVARNAADRDGTGASPWQPSIAGVAAVVGVIVITIGADTGFDEWTAAIVLSLGLVFLACLVFESMDTGIRDWMAGVAAVLYIGVLGSYLVILRSLPDGAEWVLLAVLATWLTDTAAYFVGRTVGSRKMTPRISPGKTWEGTGGAVVGGLVSVIVLDLVLGLPISFGEALLLGLLLPPVSVAADLGESMIKRGARVKDTSELIPGHGGFLDRMDSILFTVPLVYYFAIWAVI
jgi:phosphatidate cytidylyltransferase